MTKEICEVVNDLEVGDGWGWIELWDKLQHGNSWEEKNSKMLQNGTPQCLIWLVTHMNIFILLWWFCWNYSGREVKRLPCKIHETSPGQGTPPLALYPVTKSSSSEKILLQKVHLSKNPITKSSPSKKILLHKVYFPKNHHKKNIASGHHSFFHFFKLF